MRFCVALFAGLVSLGAWAAEVSIAEDRMLVVDGKRVFVLGLYENPTDDAALQAAAKAGFNLMQSKADAAALDRLQANALYAWINVGASIDLSVDEAARSAELAKLVETHAGHPAMLTWEVPDEALWNTWYSASQWFVAERKQHDEKIAALTDAAQAAELRALRDQATALYLAGDYAGAEAQAEAIWRRLGQEPPQPELKVSTAPARAAKLAQGMLAGYETLKKLDPKHPVWMNHAPRNSIAQLTAFGKAADVVGCDIYPVPFKLSGHSDLIDQSVASVGAYTRRMQESAPGKPVWMVLQGFGWNDLETVEAEKRPGVIRPPYEQSRFMAYDSIVHGARGILYWGTAYIEKDSQLWQDLLRLATELNGMQEVLVAPDEAVKPEVTYAETWGSVDRGVVIMSKKVRGQNWLLVVNEWSEPLTYTIGNLGLADNAVYKDTTTAVQGKVEGGRLTLTIPGHGVQVLVSQP